MNWRLPKTFSEGREAITAARPRIGRSRQTARIATKTIRDVARLSGVSVATVSRVFNGYSDVHPATRERVLAAAGELDYAPSAAARTLVGRRSQLVGVVLFTGYEHPDIEHPFFQDVLVGLKHGIGELGYD